MTHGELSSDEPESHSSIDPSVATVTGVASETTAFSSSTGGLPSTGSQTTSGEASTSGTSGVVETTSGVRGSSGTTGNQVETTVTSGQPSSSGTSGGESWTTSSFETTTDSPETTTGSPETTTGSSETTTGSSGTEFVPIECSSTWTIAVESMQIESMTVDAASIVLGGRNGGDGALATYGLDGVELGWDLFDVPTQIGDVAESITSLDVLPSGDLLLVVTRTGSGEGVEPDALARVDRASGGTNWMRIYTSDDLPSGQTPPPPDLFREWRDIRATDLGVVVAQGSGPAWFGGSSVAMAIDPETGDPALLGLAQGFSTPMLHGLAVDDTHGAVWQHSTEQGGMTSHTWTRRAPSGVVDTLSTLGFESDWGGLALTAAGEILVGRSGSGSSLTLERRALDHSVISTAHASGGLYSYPVRVDVDEAGRGFMLTYSQFGNPRVFVAGNDGVFMWSDTILAAFMGFPVDLVVAPGGTFYIAGRGTAAEGSFVRRYDCIELPDPE